MPRSALRASQRLGGGRVILRDVVDLMVGTNGGGSASVALFDVTTSPLAEGAERSMRYHALVETLRSSVVPLRTSTLSTATGELWTLDVDHAMLQRSAAEVLDVLNEMWCSR
jgi:fructoselysine-6-P-deglycase FrlB-like protein